MCLQFSIQTNFFYSSSASSASLGTGSPCKGLIKFMPLINGYYYFYLLLLLLLLLLQITIVLCSTKFVLLATTIKSALKLLWKTVFFVVQLFNAKAKECTYFLAHHKRRSSLFFVCFCDNMRCQQRASMSADQPKVCILLSIRCMLCSLLLLFLLRINKQSFIQLQL